MVARVRLYAAVASVVSAMCLPAPVSAQANTAAEDSVMYHLRELVVNVTGRGRTQGANALDSLVLQRVVAPGTSALRSIERLPGVNVQSADAFGAYEWSTRVTIRGFQTQQIGQTFDGVPLGDMSYGNFNGLNVVRAADASNLVASSVEQGSAGLSTASANNLGGAVSYRSSDPASQRGFRAEQMVGGFNSLRSFVRLDLGTLSFGSGADDGLRGYLSLSNTSNDKWKGGGERLSSYPGDRSLLFGQSGLFRVAENWQDQLNLKLVAQSGASRYTAFYNYSDKKEADYMDLSLGVYDSPEFGPETDYWTDWGTAKRFAEYALPPYNPLGDVAYYMSAQGARQDHFGYLRGEWYTKGVGLRLTPYYHRNRGAGDWHAPSYGASYSPDPIMFRQSQYAIDRFGVTGQVGVEIAGNELEAGLWMESNEVTIRRPRWRLASYQSGPAVNFNNVLRLDFDRTGEMSTMLFHARNTNRLMDDRLTLSYGVKYLHVGADFRSNGNTPTDGVVAPLAPDQARPSLSLVTDGGILPQVGAVLRLGASEELFANWSENVNQYPYSPQGGVYNADPSVFTFLEEGTDPERASTFDLGIRTDRERLQASLAVYGVDYRNRLIGISLCPPTVTCASGFGNVGSVRTFGSEALASVTLAEGLVWFASGSLNVSQLQDDYLANPNNPASLVEVGGSDVVDAPRHILSTSLTMDRSGLTASVGARNVAKRFFTHSNDLIAKGDGLGFVPGYTLVDASIGYQSGPLLGAASAFVRLNVKNVLDETHIATIGTNGYTVSGDNQTLLTGPSRLLYITTGLQF